METFLECETMCREPPPGHVYLGSLAEIDPRKVSEVVHHKMTKKQRLCDPFFRTLRLFRPPNLPSFIPICPSFRDLLAKTTFQIVTIIGDPSGYRTVAVMILTGFILSGLGGLTIRGLAR